jgi:iron complex transport system ATP-binding protein
MRRRHRTPPTSPVAVTDAAAASVRLRARGLRLAYDDGGDVVEDLSVDIPDGEITVIVGANACGKSTLLRALARLLAPKAGTVHLDGTDIHRLPTREVALRLGILPQQPIAPEGLTVADLVARGRAPHQRWFTQWSESDEQAVMAALEATATVDLAERPVDDLSGGQRQRAWIAMALAQGTPLMLLDEPTTFLDMAHQVEVLDLLDDLNRSEGRTIVLVLHDLNQACRYAHHLIAMRQGAIIAQGPPAAVVTEALVQDVFGLAVRVIDDPETGTPLIVPRARAVPHPLDEVDLSDHLAGTSASNGTCERSIEGSR